MKRRRVSVCGKATFLPILPSGNLEEWMVIHANRSEGSNVSRDDNSSFFTIGTEVETARRISSGRRPDMPLIRSDVGPRANHSRINYDFLENPSRVDEAMADFRRDIYAATSRRPRDALLMTWSKFHRKWYGDQSDPVPLTEESLERVACLFKIGGYKSFKNYLSRIKEHHVDSGFIWTQSLQNMARRCTRSVLRGLGGPTRSESFDLEAVVNHLLVMENNIEVMNDGPQSPLAAIVVGTFFMLRELELSAIDVGDVVFTENTVTLSLPVSKVDWQAKGCRRTWNCICGQGYICPVHILKEFHVRERDHEHPNEPWIVSNTGGRCSKAGIESAIRNATLASGGRAKDAEGNWLLSGHTFRITGARTLASWGLDPITIQMLGRWGSSAVLSYLAETPLLGFSERLKGRVAGRKFIEANDIQEATFEDDVSQDNGYEDLRRGLDSVQRSLEDLTIIVDGVSQVIEDRNHTETWWVYNDASKVMHVSVVDFNTPPLTWKTACGWRFSRQPRITTYGERPENMLDIRWCPKCNPSNSSSSSSSSSSE